MAARRHRRKLEVARLEETLHCHSNAVSNVRIENFEMRYYGAEDYRRGVLLRESTVYSGAAQQDTATRRQGYGSRAEEVKDNEIWDTFHHQLVLGLVKGSSAENYGILTTTPTDEATSFAATGSTHVNGISSDVWSAPAGGGLTNELDIYENQLSRPRRRRPRSWTAGASTSQIWTTSSATSTWVCLLLPQAPVPSTRAQRGLSVRGDAREPAGRPRASSIKLNNGYGWVDDPIFVYNNTFFSDAPNTKGLVLFPPGSNTLIPPPRSHCQHEPMIEKYSPWVISLDYDDLYTTASGDFAWWEDWSHSYTTFAAFQGALGQEPRGLSAPARLVNPAAGDSRPLASSPLIRPREGVDLRHQRCLQRVRAGHRGL